MKRGNDKSQLRAEEVDALEDEESEVIGTFKKASTAVLAGRKIVRSRSSKSASELPPPTLMSNPFGNVQLVAEPTKVSNPFGNFNGLVSSAPAPPMPAAKVSVSNEPNVEEYKKKLTKLNQSFAAWMDRQIVENPLCIWKDGLKDYIEYCTNLAEKYKITEASSKSDETTSQPSQIQTTAPAPSPAPASFSTKPLVIAEPPKPTFTSTPAFGAASAAAPFSAPFSFGAAPTVAAPAAASSTFNFFPAAPAALAAPAPVPAAAFSFPSNGFNFGAPPAAPAPAAASAFTLPSIAPTTTATSGFPFAPVAAGVPFGAAGFGAGLAFGAGAPFGGTAFGTGPPAAAAAAVGGTGGDDEDGDDEGEPILEPSKILKNAEDTDVVEYEVNCKLYRFDKDPSLAPADKWKDLGKGSFRITLSPETKKRRIVIRNTMGKILVNSYFFKGMKFESTKNTITFSVMVGAADMQRFNVKFKEDTTAATLKALEKARDSL